MGTELQGDWFAEVVDAVDAKRVLTIAQALAVVQVPLGSQPPDETQLREAIADTGLLQTVGELLFSPASLVAGRFYTARASAPLTVADHNDMGPLLGAQQHLDDPQGVAIGSSERTVVVAAAVPASLDSDDQYISIGVRGDVRTGDFGSLPGDSFVVESMGSDRFASGEREVAALRTAADGYLPVGKGLTARQLVAAAISLNGDCFTAPTLPLSDLLTAAGLVTRGNEWGRADGDWSTMSEDAEEDRIEHLIGHHQLTDDEAGDLRSVILQWRQWIGGRATVNAASFVALLSGRVAGAFAVHWQPAAVSSLDAWMDQRRLVETLARDHGGDPAVNYLRGMIDLRLGDGAAAFGFFEHAHASDEDFVPVRTELGLLHMDASRYEDGMDILPSDHPVFGAVEFVIDRATVDRDRADRGDPCRCGSGRKYRSCCLKQLRFTLTEQLALLDIRLQNYLAQPPWSLQMDRLADIASTEWGLMSFPEALSDPFIQDLLAVEAGGAAAYAAARRTLLTDADTHLLSSFVAPRRDAYDIVRANRGSRTWDLSDPDSGDRVSIPALDAVANDGDAILVRTAKVGDLLVAVGPALLIPASHVSILRVTIGSRPTAEQLLGWVCRRSEILKPSVDLTTEIDLRDRKQSEGAFDTDPSAEPTTEELLAGIDIDELARRAMES